MQHQSAIMIPYFLKLSIVVRILSFAAVKTKNATSGGALACHIPLQGIYIQHLSWRPYIRLTQKPQLFGKKTHQISLASPPSLLWQHMNHPKIPPSILFPNPINEGSLYVSPQTITVASLFLAIWNNSMNLLISILSTPKIPQKWIFEPSPTSSKKSRETRPLISNVLTYAYSIGIPANHKAPPSYDFP